MDEEILVPRRKNKAAAKLQWVFSQLVLFVAAGLGAFARLHVVPAEKMKQRSVLETNGFVGFALIVNEKWKLNAGFFAEKSGVLDVAQADHGDLRTFAAELLLKFAQLRDVLSAKDSTIMTKKDQHCRAFCPQRAQAR
jgi:hypothetical protein